MLSDKYKGYVPEGQRTPMLIHLAETLLFFLRHLKYRHCKQHCTGTEVDILALWIYSLCNLSEAEEFTQPGR